MSNLTTVRDFFALKESFENDDFNFQTVSGLLTKIREHHTDLTNKQVDLLLEIPLNILEDDVELKNNGTWQEDNRGYFLGNMMPSSEYIIKLREKFTNSNFDLKDIYELTKYVRDNFKKTIEIDFLLRIPEVTIRDDVKLQSYSTFNESGKAFAHFIERAFS